MNKDLYIELLEKKVSDLETALVTVSDKLIETEQVKKQALDDCNDIRDKYYNMKGHYDDALEVAQIIIDMIDNEESERWEKLKNYEKMTSKTENGLLLYRSEWHSVFELRDKVMSYYKSKVG